MREVHGYDMTEMDRILDTIMRTERLRNFLTETLNSKHKKFAKCCRDRSGNNRWCNAVRTSCSFVVCPHLTPDESVENIIQEIEGLERIWKEGEH